MMKMFVNVALAVFLIQGIFCVSAPELNGVEVSGAPSLSKQKQAAVEILKAKCGTFFPGRLCFPEEIVDAKTGRDGTDILISVAFKACCYVPGSTKVSNSFLVKGIYRTNPGYTPLGVSQASAKPAPASCPTLQRLNALKEGDSAVEAVLRSLDTQESHNSVASGLSRSFGGFVTNSKQFVAKYHGDLFSGYSIDLEVRGKLDRAGTEYEDFPVSASIVENGGRKEVLCLLA